MKTPSLQKAFLTLLVCIVASINSFAQFGGGSGNAEDPYLIYTKEHFEEFANEYNSLNFELYGDFSGIHLRLMNDITDTVKTTLHYLDQSETGFNGYFHGGGYSINIAPESTSSVLFGKIGENGYLDSLEIVGTPYHFTAMVYHNSGIIYSCICNVDINLPIYPYGLISGICCLNYGLIESCVNLSNFCNDIHPDTGWFDPYEISGICYWNYDTIRGCINKGNFSVKEGVLGGITTYNEGIIELCINAGNISSDNTDPENGSTFAGISGTTQINSIIRNCINSGNITFLAGIPAGGMTSDAAACSSESQIENCFNTGKIFGHVGAELTVGGGGIVGWLGHSNINNCLNIGNNGGGAIVDTSYNNSLIISSVINNFYDKQMCLSKGIADEDVSGSAEGKLTTQLTGVSPELQAMLGDGWSYAEGRYPIPLGLENDSMALVAATPVYLHFETEEEYNHVDSVSRNFTVGLENNVSWEETFGRVSFSGENVTILSLGIENLTVILGNYNKNIRINIVDIETSAPAQIIETGITAYPNPAGEFISLNLNGIQADKMEIYDITGKLLSTNNINSELTKVFTGNLKSGIYLLKFYNKSQIVTILRFVKN